MASERQIRANRANRKKRRGISPIGRLRLRIAARRNRPWEHSTGPRTAKGKATSSRNATKHGMRSREAVAERREMAEFARFIRELAASVPSSSNATSTPHGESVD